MSAAEKMICLGNMPLPRFGKPQILADTHVCMISKHDLSTLHGLNMANWGHCSEISQQNDTKPQFLVRGWFEVIPCNSIILPRKLVSSFARPSSFGIGRQNVQTVTLVHTL